MTTTHPYSCSDQKEDQCLVSQRLREESQALRCHARKIIQEFQRTRDEIADARRRLAERTPSLPKRN